MNQFEQKPVNVVNNLTSDSTTDALSAAQGKALNGKFKPSQIQSIDNINGLKTYLLNMFDSIGNRECIAVCFQPQFEDNNFIVYGVYHGLLYRSLTGFFTCTVSDNNGNMTVISYNNGQTWTFESFKSLNSNLAKHELPRTKTVEHSFSGSGVSTWDLVLASDKSVTLTAYNGGSISMYTPNGDNNLAVCSATAPSNIVQFSCGNTVYCKAGTYTVYYYGASSSSSGAVSSWS